MSFKCCEYPLTLEIGDDYLTFRLIKSGFYSVLGSKHHVFRNIALKIFQVVTTLSLFFVVILMNFAL